jgi:hypothetical protein
MPPNNFTTTTKDNYALKTTQQLSPPPLDYKVFN